MTNSQKAKGKQSQEKAAQTSGSFCDDSCCMGGIPSVRFEGEGRRKVLLRKVVEA